MIKTTVKIDGMHCASCSTIIEKGLGKQPGIQNISVNLASNTANIKYDETQTDINTISKNIGDLGYKVVEHLDNNGAKKYLKKFIIALILSLPIAATMFIHLKEIFGANMFAVDSILLVLGTIVVFFAGRNFHVGFIKKLKQGQSNMDTLISI